mgnify:CR=1 FL=1
MNWFINKVYAETAGTAPAMEDVGMGSLLLSSILPFALIILVMYFMLIRPQRKKEKTLRDQINNMKIGDEITTIGGIMGKIVSIKDDEVTIETSIERTKLQMNKYAIKDIKQYEQA